jgi:hypothetical protein
MYLTRGKKRRITYVRNTVLEWLIQPKTHRWGSEPFCGRGIQYRWKATVPFVSVVSLSPSPRVKLPPKKWMISPSVRF